MSLRTAQGLDTQQATKGATSVFADTKAFSGFAVPDIEQAREFYGDTLGIKMPSRAQ